MSSITNESLICQIREIARFAHSHASELDLHVIRHEFDMAARGIEGRLGLMKLGWSPESVPPEGPRDAVDESIADSIDRAIAKFSEGGVQ